MSKLIVDIREMEQGKTKVLTHNGDKYKAIDPSQPAKKGDIIETLHAWGSQGKGEFYREISENHSMYNGDREFVFIAGAVGDASTYRDRVNVLRKAGSVPEPVKAGEYAVVTKGMNGSTKPGDVVLVVEVLTGVGSLVRVELPDGTPAGVKFRDRLRKATDDEVEAASSARKETKLGDKVVFSDTRGEVHLTPGKPYKIVDIDEEGDYVIKNDVGSNQFVIADPLQSRFTYKVVQSDAEVTEPGDIIRVIGDKNGKTATNGMKAAGWGSIGQGIAYAGTEAEVVRVVKDGIIVDFGDRDVPKVDPEEKHTFFLREGEYELTGEAVLNPNKTREIEPGDIVKANEDGKVIYGRVLRPAYGPGRGGNLDLDTGDIVLKDDTTLVAKAADRLDQ